MVAAGGGCLSAGWACWSHTAGVHLRVVKGIEGVAIRALWHHGRALVLRSSYAGNLLVAHLVAVMLLKVVGVSCNRLLLCRRWRIGKVLHLLGVELRGVDAVGGEHLLSVGHITHLLAGHDLAWTTICHHSTGLVSIERGTVEAWAF